MCCGEVTRQTIAVLHLQQYSQTGSSAAVVLVWGY